MTIDDLADSSEALIKYSENKKNEYPFDNQMFRNANCDIEE